jgi:hypothetical protein
MEMFSAGDEEQWKTIARQIDEVDYYIVIIAHRYGSLTEGISFTEKEYDYAVKQGVPVLGFLIEDEASWQVDRIDREPRKKKSLQTFKRKVKKKPVGFWKDKKDLYGMVPIALIKAIQTNPRIGWVKANEAAGPEVVKELTRLSTENAELRRKISAIQKQASREEVRELKKLLTVLPANKVPIRVWKKYSKNWSDPIDTDLFTIFNIIAADLIGENAVNALAGRIAVSVFNTTDIRRVQPLPVNTMNDLLANFAALDLVQPSPKKHSVTDPNEYWVLTPLGKQLFTMTRRFVLENEVK